MAFLPIIGPVVGVVGEILKRVLPAEKMNEADRAQIEAAVYQEILKADFSAVTEQVKAQAQIIASEAGGESWLQRNWRPILMLTITTIVANNYVVAPYLGAMGLTHVTLDLPERLWDLMTLGVGGYIASRGLEKVTRTWKAKE